jgi:hypothetical protein
VGGRPARPAINIVTIHGFMLLFRLVDLSSILCLMNIIITAIRIVQYILIKMNRLFLLSIAANIIQLRLKIEDRAMISISLFLFICMILPKTLLIRILTTTTVFIMNIRI